MDTINRIEQEFFCFLAMIMCCIALYFEHKRAERSTFGRKLNDNTIYLKKKVRSNNINGLPSLYFISISHKNQRRRHFFVELVIFSKAYDKLFVSSSSCLLRI